MASKVFLDANILLDFTLKRESYLTAKPIIQMAVSGQIKAHITPSIVQMTGYWLTKAYSSSKAKELLLTLLADIEVIEITHELTLTALHSKIGDIEDAMQYYTAIHNKIDLFISRDKILKKSAIPLLPVYSPDEFLQEFGI
jgi:predicted nucleic acid-binding protein